MGWFEEQLRQRRLNDEELFEDSVIRMASAVLGKHRGGILSDERIVTQAAIDQVLKYYHFKPVTVPSKIKDPGERLEYALRPHGMMYRNVTLSGSWYQEAYGPMMVRRLEDDLPVVLFPRPFRGYYWTDDNGHRHIVSRETMAQFDTEALCFYKPLPQRKIGIPDLLGYIRECMGVGDCVVLVALTLLVTLTGMMIPRMIRVLTGFVINSGRMPFLWGTAVFMLCVLIASQLFSVSRSLAMYRIQIKTALSVEAAMMMRLMSLPASFFKQYSSGELASRSGAINALCNILLGSVFSLGVSAVVSLLYIYQIFIYTPVLGLPSILIVLITMGVSCVTAVWQSKVTRKLMERSAGESGMSYALISSVQKIRLSGAEKRAFARWAQMYAKSAEMEYNPPLFLKMNQAITIAISLAGTVVLYYLAAVSDVSPSEFLAFSAAYGAMTGAFTAFSDQALSVAQIRPILEMAEPILKAEPEIAEDKEIVTQVSGNIELSGVYFRYHEQMPYVIRNMNLRIRAGEYLAIVGTTGCGKSTLMRLLLGFETPEKGAIYYDNRDLRTMDLRSLRRRMGVVTQDGSLFQGDIFSNITVSAPQLTLDEAWEAAEMAGIADDIRAMPMGMHTVISEGQGGVSGGQKQRILIARAIAPKPKILLFDEATSALDNRTQKMVSDSLDALKCTRIVIAHRLSTIKHCDRILVMDQGQIVEQGNYEQLLAADGLFTKLVERQRVDVSQ